MLNAFPLYGPLYFPVFQDFFSFDFSFFPVNRVENRKLIVLFPFPDVFKDTINT